MTVSTRDGKCVSLSETINTRDKFKKCIAVYEDTQICINNERSNGREKTYMSRDGLMCSIVDDDVSVEKKRFLLCTQQLYSSIEK